jgi:tRNA-dihydrouridine synthase B
MERADLRDLLEAAPARLAPMAAYTNLPFRLIAVECGSGYVTNEEIDAEALVRHSPRTEVMMERDPAEGVVAYQLLGNRVETLVPAAIQLVEAGAEIIDLNMGCPVPKIVRQGKGAALMRDVVATSKVLAALRAAVDVPLTIKIRGGWDDHTLNAVEVARMAQEVGVDAITVHPRTRMERFGGRAPWQLIADVVQAVDIPVTGNGDVTSLAEAQRMREETGCASVMIGRGAMGRPWIFDPAYEALDHEERAAYRERVTRRHLDLIEERLPPHPALVQMKKHLGHYLYGRPEARALRGQVFQLPNIASVRAIADRYFAEDAHPERIAGRHA